jgi:hypothetical protein
MRSVRSNCAAFAVALLVPAVLAAQTNLDVGLGFVVRGSDRSAIAFRILPGIAGELGLSRSVAERTRLRVDVGGQLFGEAVAMPDCIPGGDCRTQRNLTREAHATASLDRQLAGGPEKPRVFAGVGAYWTGTAGRDVSDGRRSAATAGVNGGASIALGRTRAEGRLHVPIGDLAEVQWMATVLIRVPVLGARN